MIKKVTTTKYIDIDNNQEYQYEPVENTITCEKTEDGYKLKYLVQDENPISPDENGDESLFLVHYHRDFWVKSKYVEENQLIDYLHGNIDEEEKENHQLNGFYIFELSALIHSGVWLKLGRTSFEVDPGGWDTSHCGCVLASKKEFDTEEKAYNAAKALTEEWNSYLSGDVYGCVVENLDKDKKMINFDSCWGFTGFEYAKQALVSEF